jgi:hypothetical protein
MSASSHHGHTPAAWTAVGIMLLGFVVGGVGVVLAELWLFWVGVAMVALGAVVGKVMSMMGLGQAPGYHQEEAEQRAGEEPRQVT